MKRLLIITIFMIIASFTFAALTESGNLQIVLNPENMNLARAGFSDAAVTGVEEPEPSTGVLYLNEIRRSGSRMIASHSQPVYAFCQIYSGSRYSVSISVTSASQRSDVPVTVSWTDNTSTQRSVSSAGGSYNIFVYNTDTALDVRSYPLVVEATLPEILTANDAENDGVITLTLTCNE